jgi:hypothetical protein
VDLGEPNRTAAGQRRDRRLLYGFFVLTSWVLGVALAILLIAVLSGPYRRAAAIRSSVQRAGRSIAGAPGSDRRSALAWIGSHSRAAPISFKGRLARYAARSLRSYPRKATAEIHDYHDTATGVLAASLAKRAAGYTSLGFPRPPPHPSRTQ